MYEAHKENYKGFDIKIIQDDYPERPDSWGDSGLFLVSDHRDIDIRHDMVSKPGRDYGKRHTTILRGEGYQRKFHTFELFGYSHSGVGLSLSRDTYPFSCPWDGFYTGAVFVSVKEAKTREEARKLAESLVSTWNNYLSNNVWGYIITKDEVCDKCYHNEPEDIDSCWGFVGDYDYCLAEAKSVVDHMTTQVA